MKIFLLLLLLGAPCLAGEENTLAEIQQMVVEGKLAEARTALTEALRNRKDDAGLWNLMGVVNAQLGDIGAAEQAFRQAVRIAPKVEGAWLNLGRLYQMQSVEPDAAAQGVAAYETVLRLNAHSSEAHHQLGLLYFLNQRYTESLAHLDRLPAADQASRAALIIRCADVAALGDAAKASQIAKKIFLDPGVEEGDFLPVLSAIAARNGDVAFFILEELDKRQLGTEKTWSQLGAACERRGDWKRARELYEKVAHGRPDDMQPLMELARVAWQQKDFEGALGYLAHARDLQPESAAVHFLFGITCNELRLPGDARQALGKAVELEPDNAYYNYALGSVLLQWSDKTPAVPYLEKFVALRPTDARGHLALATAYAGTGRLADAKAQLAVPLKDDRTKAGAAYLLGSIAREEGETEVAIRSFRQVIEREPQSAEARAELGALLLEKGEVETARRETERALAGNPRSYRANATLLKLYRDAKDPRLASQVELLKKLVSDREAEFQLLHRSIEFQTH